MKDVYKCKYVSRLKGMADLGSLLSTHKPSGLDCCNCRLEGVERPESLHQLRCRGSKIALTCDTTSLEVALGGGVDLGVRAGLEERIPSTYLSDVLVFLRLRRTLFSLY